jgi:hypothetical protein
MGSGKDARMRVAKKIIVVYNTSEGGAHGIEGEDSQSQYEGANDAAPPRSEVLTRPVTGFQASPLPPLVRK